MKSASTTCVFSAQAEHLLDVALLLEFYYFGMRVGTILYDSSSRISIGLRSRVTIASVIGTEEIECTVAFKVQFKFGDWEELHF